MPQIIAATGLVITGSMICGSAIWALAGMPSRSTVAPAVGFGALVTLVAITIRLPGRTVPSTVALALALAASLGYLKVSGSRPVLPLWAVITAGLVAALAMLPFGVSGRAGLLGVGTNDDLVEHLLAAWTLQGQMALSSSKIIAAGYPIGPHSLAATIAAATGLQLERVFTGIILAVPALLALAAAALLRKGPRVLGAAVAAAVGLCYLQAAYLVQASFKEPMEALVLVAFAACLHELDCQGSRSQLRAVPLGVLAAGSVYIYSYLGLLWLGGTLFVWSAARVVTRRPPRDEIRPCVRSWTSPLAISGVVFLALVAPEIPRMIRFVHSGYNHEAANALGNLLRPLPPQEALGIWPRADFRFDVPLTSGPGVLTLVALAALVGCLIRCLRRRDFAVSSALIVAAALYGLSTTRSPYTAAKALAVLAPVVTLLLGREMLVILRASPSARARSRVGTALLGTLLAAGAYSDLLVLRNGSVGPSAHSQELSGLRRIIGHRPTLFLGTDLFVHWELRGGNVATPPGFHTTIVVPVRRSKALQGPGLYHPSNAAVTTNRLAATGLEFDFDSVPSQVLDRFTFVILPRSAYNSAPPPGWRLVRTMRSYQLWRRSGPTFPHQTLTEIDNPGTILDCKTTAGREIASRAGVAMVRPVPVVGGYRSWEDLGYAGRASQQILPLGVGTWDISLQYYSTVDVTLYGPGLRAVLPASQEPIGPYWFAGSVRVARPGRVRIVAADGSLPTLGRIVAAISLTRAQSPTGLTVLGRIAATRSPSREHPIPLERACGRYVDWYGTPPGL